MLPVVQFPDVFSDVGAPNASVALDAHVVSQCKHNLGTEVGREVEVCIWVVPGLTSGCTRTD